MVTVSKKAQAKRKRLAKGQRIQVRRMKQAARKAAGVSG